MDTHKAKAGDLKPGERIVVNLPCVVEVVDYQENPARRPGGKIDPKRLHLLASHALTFKDARVLATEGDYGLGSLVDVEVVEAGS